MGSTRPATIILASSSPWRRQLLAQLGIKFEATSPEIDESAHDGEAPAALAERLAIGKASKIFEASPNAIVIGSDQVADVEGDILGKPGTAEKARAQLRHQRLHRGSNRRGADGARHRRVLRLRGQLPGLGIAGTVGRRRRNGRDDGDADGDGGRHARRRGGGGGARRGARRRGRPRMMRRRL